MRPLAVAAGLAAAAALMGACADDPRGYSDATEAVFLEVCAAGLTAGGTDVCQCAYDEVVDRYSFAEYEELDRELRDDPEAVSPELQRIVLDCEADVVSPSSGDEK